MMGQTRRLSVAAVLALLALGTSFPSAAEEVADQEELSPELSEGVEDEIAEDDFDRREVEDATSAVERSDEDEDSRAISRPLPRPALLDERVREELTRYERSLRVYEDELRDYQQTVGRVIEADFQRRRNRISDEYGQRIDPVRLETRQRRLSAIEEFENFVERYPDDPEHSPDVLYRLTVLYFENGREESLLRAGMSFGPGTPSVDTLEPEKYLNAAVSTSEQLVRAFPDYRFLDGALYLQSVSHEALAEFDDAYASMRRLVEVRPESRLAQEAWFRIGEYYFERYTETPGLLRDANAAYAQAAEWREGAWFDLSLYNLGWTNYLLNRYERSLANFRELLQLYDDEESDIDGDMRDEAVVYYATILARLAWCDPMASEEDCVDERLAQHVPADDAFSLDVIEELYQRFLRLQGVTSPEDLEDQDFGGDYFRHAIRVYEHAIDTHFEDGDTPRRHRDIVRLQRNLREEERAFTLLASLPERYGPGTEWYRVQEREGNLDAMEAAEALSRDALYDTASWNYVRGMQARESADPGERAGATQHLRMAAEQYADFLENYPNDEEVYAVMSWRAQALYSAEEWREAAVAFEKLRDSFLSEEFLEFAATRAVAAWSHHLETRIEAGEIEARALPGHDPQSPHEAPIPRRDEAVDGRGQGRDVVRPEPIPEDALHLVDAFDAYVEYDLDDAEEPGLQGEYARDAARVFNAYRYYDEARARFARIMRDYCGERVTGEVASLMLRSYQDEDDLEKMIRWATLISEDTDCITLPGEEREQFAATIDHYRRLAAFDRAERLENEGRFDEAVVAYLEIADAHPESREALASLFRAGWIYEEELGSNYRALQTYELLMERFPENEFRIDALSSIAVTSTRFFAYERAIDALRSIDDVAREEGVQPPGSPPLLRAAGLLGFQQRYAESAAEYMRFVERTEPGSTQLSVLRDALRAYDRAGDSGGMERVLERVERDYLDRDITTDPNPELVFFDALHRLHALYEERGVDAQAGRYAERIQSEFSVRRPTQPQATRGAAELALRQMRNEVEAWRNISYVPPAAGFEDVLENRARKSERATELHNDLQDLVTTYRYLPVSLCAFYEMGRVYSELAEWLLAYDYPDPVFDDPDLMDDLDDLFFDEADRREELAIADWLQLRRLAAEEGLRNECLDRAVQGLNRLGGPDEFPLLRDDARPRVPRLSAPAPYHPTDVEEDEATELFPGADFDGTGGEQ